jgi:nickel-dependent lactate racemase
MGSLLFARGGVREKLADRDLEEGLFAALDRLGSRKKVLVVPPDLTRSHSRAGALTRSAYRYFGTRLAAVLPAVGTHFPMTAGEIETMFPGVPVGLFREHDWRGGIATLGTVPAEFVRAVSEGAVDYSWPAEVDRLIVQGGFDLILSIGQVVPHEVAGMANYTKNIFVGTGGREGINRSHFLGAAYGMERVMGRTDNPVRRVLNFAAEHFAADLPIVYAHTVVATSPDGSLVTRGLFVGDDQECFLRAAELSQKVNITLLDKPLGKVVVYLDPTEFRSTWLGNKSIYRTRMAIADGGELVVLAPGVREFGEDRVIDALVRRYGYVGRDRVARLVKDHEDLASNLSAAAHLIHGSTDGRFAVTYCPGGLTKEQIEGVGFSYGDAGEMLKRYDPARLQSGVNVMPGGEEIFFIPNPAIGLWADRARFESV